MTLDYTALRTAPRLLLEADLRPLQGNRFQPTGFADLGPARYKAPSIDGVSSGERLLVESAQSVANRTEAVCWSEADDNLIVGLRGLPYVLVQMPDGRGLTNSILEAHRINSEYIMKSGGKSSTFHLLFAKEIEYASNAPVNWKKFANALFKYDPNSLIHGCFLEEIGGRLRITRALSGFIEAENIGVAESGGVKNNRIQPKLKVGEGNVIFPRTEFTASSIVAYFNLDLALLRGYGLSENATQLLISLALFKVRRFLATGLRLRTACDLDVNGELRCTKPDTYTLPSETDLLSDCTRLIKICAADGLFANPAVTPVRWETEVLPRQVDISNLPSNSPNPTIPATLKKFVKWNPGKKNKPASLEIKAGIDKTDEELAKTLFPTNEEAQQSLLEMLALPSPEGDSDPATEGDDNNDGTDNDE